MNPQIEYYEDGQIELEEWRNEARELHRLDGPAYQEWDEDGQLLHEMWYINGELHRLDGPAWQGWTPSGWLVTDDYYINGVKYKTEAEFQVAVDLYKANEIAELF